MNQVVGQLGKSGYNNLPQAAAWMLGNSIVQRLTEYLDSKSARIKFWLCQLTSSGIWSKFIHIIVSLLPHLWNEHNNPVFYWLQDALDCKTHHVPLRKNNPTNELEHSVFLSRRLFFFFFFTNLAPVPSLGLAKQHFWEKHSTADASAAPSPAWGTFFHAILQDDLTGRCQQEVSDQNQEGIRENK